MHHALEIQEILSNIISHCSPSLRSRLLDPRAGCDLSALARTCRTFKEQALDALWEELKNPSPVVRCLPEAAQKVPPDKYTFHRPLTPTEWDILQSYTRRIRSIIGFQSGLDWASVAAFLDTSSLFPNLRRLYCQYADETLPISNQPFPLLVFFDIQFSNPCVFQQALMSFARFSPDIRRLCIRMRRLETLSIKIEPNRICCWQNLCSVVCPQIALGVDDLIHLSRMSALTRLDFTLDDILMVSCPPLLFSSLNGLALQSRSLQSISQLLLQIRLPVITSFSAIIAGPVSSQQFSSFFANIEESGISRTIKLLWLKSSLVLDAVHRPVLVLEDLRPCMAISNLYNLELNIWWNVDLDDNDLLTLASAWPHLETFFINLNWGWNTSGGITPNGMLRLLQTCRSLTAFALAMDTRGFAEGGEVAQNLGSASLEVTLPPRLTVIVIDSVIEEECVPAVAAFFAGIALHSSFVLSAWDCETIGKPPGWTVYKNRWDDVRKRVNSVPGRWPIWI